MELFLPALVLSIFASLLALYLIHHLLSTTRAAHKKAAAPPPVAAGSWPVIGHLPTLGGPKLLHIVLGAMADKYGPIFTINLGMRRAVVVCDRELAKECFTTNDKALATRPKAMAIELMGYNYAIFGFSAYGPYWRLVRKITTLEFLSNRRVEMFQNVHLSEVKASIKELNDACRRSDGGTSAAVEMKRWFGALTMNIIVRLLAGERYSREEGDDERLRFVKAMREFFEYEGMIVPSDYLPFLRWVDWGGHEKAMKRIAEELDEILGGWLEEHKRRRSGIGVAASTGGDKDFIDIMLTQLDEITAEELDGRDADTINKSTCLAILSGGSETTVVSLTWALSLLLNNRHVLKKARAELDHHVGLERQVDQSDLKNLVYLQAIVKETLRLYPAVPLLAPHEAMEDCTIGGFHVAAGTRLIVNCWKIHRDPGAWSDPGKFRPERFLGEHQEVDVRGQHFELIPFGSGRRMCPGISLAFQIMQLTLAYLVHEFELETPSGEPVDMTEAPGLTNLKATPLQVLLSPRLAHNLYG